MVTRRHNDPELHGLPHPEQSASHYSTPEGFLDGLAETIMSRLPDEQELAEVPALPVSWWTKAKPIVYLAACFVGLALIFQGIRSLETKTGLTAEDKAKVEAIDDSEWAVYYSEYSSAIIDQDHERELSREIDQL